MAFFERRVYNPEPAVPSELNRALRIAATEHLLRGRANWDLPHTKAVVYFAGEIARAEGADERVLVTAAWFHDTGYRDLFSGDSGDYDEIQKRKAAHAVKGAEYVRTFLDSEGISRWYTPAQKERVAHLVTVHDDVASHKALDEIIIMEADTLGMLHTGLITPTFELRSAESFRVELTEQRLVRFATKKGREFLPAAYDTFEQYIASLRAAG